MATYIDFNNHELMQLREVLATHLCMEGDKEQRSSIEYELNKIGRELSRRNVA